jgi:hypothetical protein
MLSHMKTEQPQIDKFKLISFSFVAVTAAYTLLFDHITPISRMGHAAALLFGVALVLGLILPLLLQYEKYALYAILSLVYEALVFLGGVGALIFPELDIDFRPALARYLGKGHPGATAGMILLLGLLMWLLKRWRLYGYGCVEIGFAVASGYYTALSANPGDPRPMPHLR